MRWNTLRDNKMEQKPSFLGVVEEITSTKKLSNITFVGKGSFKETYKVNANTKTVALKIWDPVKCDPIRSQREIEALRKCDSHLIGKLYLFDKFSSSNGNEYYFSLEEFLDGGTLTEKIQHNSLTPAIIRNYAISFINTLAYLKEIKLVHRDIKPDNIMFRTTSPLPVLVDLGIARHLDDTSLTASCLSRGPCSPYYAAPEQLNNDKHLIDWRTDQFSVGLVLGICLTGKHPFAKEGMNNPQIIESVENRNKCTEQFCSEVNSLGFGGIIKMLEPWPIRRYQSIEDLLKSFMNKE